MNPSRNQMSMTLTKFLLVVMILLLEGDYVLPISIVYEYYYILVNWEIKNYWTIASSGIWKGEIIRICAREEQWLTLNFSTRNWGISKERSPCRWISSWMLSSRRTTEQAQLNRFDSCFTTSLSLRPNNSNPLMVVVNFRFCRRLTLILTWGGAYRYD